MANKKTTSKEVNVHRQVCEYIKLQYPKVIFNTDLSGIRLTIGQAVKLKSLRSSRAFPDLVIYEPRYGFHGMFIELKREGEVIYNKNFQPATPHIKEQLDFMLRLRAVGYNAIFCCGFEAAKKEIDEYLMRQK